MNNSLKLNNAINEVKKSSHVSFTTRSNMKYVLAIISDLVSNGGKTTVTLGIEDTAATEELAKKFGLTTKVESNIGSYRYNVTISK